MFWSPMVLSDYTVTLSYRKLSCVPYRPLAVTSKITKMHIHT